MAKPKRSGLRKPSKVTYVKRGGGIGDTTMEDAEKFDADGGGVDENVRNVGMMPNESVMKPEDLDHLR